MTASLDTLEPSPPTSTYDQLLDLLDRKQVPYRLMAHQPEGQTVRASALRGHALAAAAKCMIVTLLKAKRVHGHVLAVIPGDRRVDFKRVARACGADKAGFADRETAEELGRTVSGTITPFAFHPALEVLADPALLDQETLYFNAARLDCSVALGAEDYLRVAQPRVVAIT